MYHITIKQLREACQYNWLLSQLFSVKRIWGPKASIGLLGDDGQLVTYRTVADLVEHEGLNRDFLWLEPWLVRMPMIHEYPYDDYRVISSKFADRMRMKPTCPWVEAEKVAEEARVRASRRRVECRNKFIVAMTLY